MRSRFSQPLKFICLLLIGALLAEQVVFAAPDFKPAQNHFFDKPTVAIRFPESVASVEDSWNAGVGTKTVYLFQDAHANLSGQTNLSRALDHLLIQESGLRWIFMEGGFGDSSLSFLRAYANPAERRVVADRYIKKGLLHGEEHLDLSSDRDMALWGVENLSLYMQALEAYKKTAKSRERFIVYLAGVDAATESLKSALLNPRLLALDRQILRYRRNEISITDYADVLTSSARDANVATNNFKDLQLFSKLREAESKIDFKQASLEQVRAVASLSESDRKEITELSESANRSPFKVAGEDKEGRAAFYAALVEKLAGRTAEYLEFSKYLTYLESAKKVQAENILTELSDLEKKVLAALSWSADESNLLRASEAIALYKKLFQLQMTPQEYREYKTLASSFGIERATGFINKMIVTSGIARDRALLLENGFEEIVKDAETFYDLTLRRDESMVENMLQKLGWDGRAAAVGVHDERAESARNGQPPTGPAPSKAVLIAGGFHAVNLKAILKSKNISYVSIRPQILHETNQSRYESKLFGQKLNPSFSPMAPALSTLRDFTAVLSGTLPPLSLEFQNSPPVAAASKDLDSTAPVHGPRWSFFGLLPTPLRRLLFGMVISAGLFAADSSIEKDVSVEVGQDQAILVRFLPKLHGGSVTIKVTYKKSTGESKEKSKTLKLPDTGAEGFRIKGTELETVGGKATVKKIEVDVKGAGESLAGIEVLPDGARLASQNEALIQEMIKGIRAYHSNKLREAKGFKETMEGLALIVTVGGFFLGAYLKRPALSMGSFFGGVGLGVFFGEWVSDFISKTKFAMSEIRGERLGSYIFSKKVNQSLDDMLREAGISKGVSNVLSSYEGLPNEAARSRAAVALTAYREHFGDGIAEEGMKAALGILIWRLVEVDLNRLELALTESLKQGSPKPFLSMVLTRVKAVAQGSDDEVKALIGERILNSALPDAVEQAVLRRVLGDQIPESLSARLEMVRDTATKIERMGFEDEVTQALIEQILEESEVYRPNPLQMSPAPAAPPVSQDDGRVGGRRREGPQGARLAVGDTNIIILRGAYRRFKAHGFDSRFRRFDNFLRVRFGGVGRAYTVSDEGRTAIEQNLSRLSKMTTKESGYEDLLEETHRLILAEILEEISFHSKGYKPFEDRQIRAEVHEGWEAYVSVGKILSGKPDAFKLEPVIIEGRGNEKDRPRAQILDVMDLVLILNILSDQIALEQKRLYENYMDRNFGGHRFWSGRNYPELKDAIRQLKETGIPASEIDTRIKAVETAEKAAIASYLADIAEDKKIGIYELDVDGYTVQINGQTGALLTDVPQRNLKAGQTVFLNDLVRGELREPNLYLQIGKGAYKGRFPIAAATLLGGAVLLFASVAAWKLNGTSPKKTSPTSPKTEQGAPRAPSKKAEASKPAVAKPAPVVAEQKLQTATPVQISLVKRLITEERMKQEDLAGKVSVATSFRSKNGKLTTGVLVTVDKLTAFDELDKNYAPTRMEIGKSSIAFKFEDGTRVVVRVQPANKLKDPAKKLKRPAGARLSAIPAEVAQAFEVSTAQMNQIATRFGEEMRSGLAGTPASLKMLDSYVRRVDMAQLNGNYMSIDVGGTNLRVIKVRIESGKVIEQDIQQVPIDPRLILSGTAEQLFDLIATQIKKAAGTKTEYKLGVSFAFPLRHEAVDRAVLVHWDKGWNVSGVVNTDVMQHLRSALAQVGANNISANAIVNDTVGTLMGWDMGVILGTGTNGAYFEKDGGATNIEWGNFGGFPEDLRNAFDRVVDGQDVPEMRGKMLFEKMVSGKYLGEYIRLLALDLSRSGTLPEGIQTSSYFTEVDPESGAGKIETADLSAHLNRRSLLTGQYAFSGDDDIDIFDQLIRMVALKSARIFASALAATALKIDPAISKPIRIGIDGSVYQNFPGYQEMVREALNEILGQEKAENIQIGVAKDGSGLGAALISAMVDAASSGTAGARLSLVVSRETRGNYPNNGVVSSYVVYPNNEGQVSPLEDVLVAIVAAENRAKKNRGEASTIPVANVQLNGIPILPGVNEKVYVSQGEVVTVNFTGARLSAHDHHTKHHAEIRRLNQEIDHLSRRIESLEHHGRINTNVYSEAVDRRDNARESLQRLLKHGARLASASRNQALVTLSVLQKEGLQAKLLSDVLGVVGQLKGISYTPGKKKTLKTDVYTLTAEDTAFGPSATDLALRVEILPGNSDLMVSVGLAGEIDRVTPQLYRYSENHVVAQSLIQLLAAKYQMHFDDVNGARLAVSNYVPLRKMVQDAKTQTGRVYIEAHSHRPALYGADDAQYNLDLAAEKVWQHYGEGAFYANRLGSEIHTAGVPSTRYFGEALTQAYNAAATRKTLLVLNVDGQETIYNLPDDAESAGTEIRNRIYDDAMRIINAWPAMFDSVYTIEQSSRSGAMLIEIHSKEKTFRDSPYGPRASLRRYTFKQFAAHIDSMYSSSGMVIWIQMKDGTIIDNADLVHLLPHKANVGQEMRSLEYGSWRNVDYQRRPIPADQIQYIWSRDLDQPLRSGSSVNPKLKPAPSLVSTPAATNSAVYVSLLSQVTGLATAWIGHRVHEGARPEFTVKELTAALDPEGSLNRTHAYQTIQGFIQKGFVTETHRDSKNGTVTYGLTEEGVNFFAGARMATVELKESATPKWIEVNGKQLLYTNALAFNNALGIPYYDFHVEYKDAAAADVLGEVHFVSRGRVVGKISVPKLTDKWDENSKAILSVLANALQEAGIASTLPAYVDKPTVNPISEVHLSEPLKQYLRELKVIAFVSPPWAGKGTQITWLKKELGFPSLEMGDYARGGLLYKKYINGELAEDNPTFLEFESMKNKQDPKLDEFRQMAEVISEDDFALMGAGKMMSDATAQKMINLALSWARYEGAEGLVVDGYPRNNDQFEGVLNGQVVFRGAPLKVGLYVVMNVDEPTLIKRAAYVRGERPDNGKVEERLRVFRADTLPFMERLAGDRNSVAIDANDRPGSREQSILEVRREMVSVLESRRLKLGGARLAQDSIIQVSASPARFSERVRVPEYTVIAADKTLREAVRGNLTELKDLLVILYQAHKGRLNGERAPYEQSVYSIRQSGVSYTLFVDGQEILRVDDIRLAENQYQARLKEGKTSTAASFAGAERVLDRRLAQTLEGAPQISKNAFVGIDLANLRARSSSLEEFRALSTYVFERMANSPYRFVVTGDEKLDAKGVSQIQGLTQRYSQALSGRYFIAAPTEEAVVVQVRFATSDSVNSDHLLLGEREFANFVEVSGTEVPFVSGAFRIAATEATVFAGHFENGKFQAQSPALLDAIERAGLLKALQMAYSMKTSNLKASDVVEVAKLLKRDLSQYLIRPIAFVEDLVQALLGKQTVDQSA